VSETVSETVSDTVSEPVTELPRGPEIADLKLVPTTYEPLDSDGEWLISGGCVHLALALKEVFPAGKIAVAWYSDHGRRAIAHAAFYDPATGHAWDGCGSWDHYQVAVSGHAGAEIEDDADMIEIARQMEIPFNPNAPFENDLLMDAWCFAEKHFLPEMYAERQAEYGFEDDDW
jgi:hypothetical protein